MAIDRRTKIVATLGTASESRESLRTLLGSEAPTELDVDDEEFEPPEVKERVVTYYEDLARANRPEVRLLEYAVMAKSALSDLERRKEYPDLVLIATGVFAVAQTVDEIPSLLRHALVAEGSPGADGLRRTEP